MKADSLLRARKVANLIFSILQGIVLLAYPLAIYLGLSRLSTRGVSFLVLAALLPGLIRSLKNRPAQAKGLIGIPLTVALLMTLAVIFNDERFVLIYPALVNLVLLLQFAFTLRPRAQTMIERFARLQVDDLSASELVYCRRVTVGWCLFFVLNGAACAFFAARAAAGERAIWALYTGLISYLLLGFFFAVEFVLRKYLFRRLGPNLLDRVFAHLFPPRG